jgi:hypothetical protein
LQVAVVGALAAPDKRTIKLLVVQVVVPQAKQVLALHLQALAAVAELKLQAETAALLGVVASLAQQVPSALVVMVVSLQQQQVAAAVAAILAAAAAAATTVVQVQMAAAAAAAALASILQVELVHKGFKLAMAK